MTRRLIPLALLALLAACGGSTGPVNTACLASGRAAANPSSCGCVQRVAHDTLGWGDQRRAVKFFRNPDLAETARRSDSPGDKDFWKRYAAFSRQAEAICRR